MSGNVVTRHQDRTATQRYSCASVLIPADAPGLPRSGQRSLCQLITYRNAVAPSMKQLYSNAWLLPANPAPRHIQQQQRPRSCELLD